MGKGTTNFKRRRKTNGNMFNLISSINIKYFDDIIIKDVSGADG